MDDPPLETSETRNSSTLVGGGSGLRYSARLAKTRPLSSTFCDVLRDLTDRER